MPKTVKVLLLNPPTAAPSSVPLLNLAYLSAVLKQSDCEVRTVDATAPQARRSEAEVEAVVKEFAPNFIGVTLTISSIAQTYAYLQRLSRLGVPIVAGGPHANALPEEVIDRGGVSIVCVGEGEETAREIAAHFAGERELSAISGLCYKDGAGKVVRTPPRKMIKDLDTIPLPDLSDFPVGSYCADGGAHPLFWSVFSSRGCPFDCIFCSSHNVFGRSMRLRTAQNVFDEIKALASEHGAKTIAFQDDELLCVKKRFIEFCDLVAGSGLKLRMSIRTRIDSIDPEVLEKAKAAGITRISFGIESFNDETLKKINKLYTVAEIHKRFAHLSAAQPLPVSFNIICGFPWETRAHLQSVLDEISKLPENIRFFPTAATPIPYPKTKMYEMYHKEYGFAGWWLKEENHRTTFPDGRRPLFVHFARMFCPLYITDHFWGYSARMQEDLVWFTWRLFDLMIRRHYTLPQRLFVYALCRLSRALWLASPALERLVLSWLMRLPAVRRLQEALDFTTKYAD